MGLMVKSMMGKGKRDRRNRGVMELNFSVKGKMKK